MFDLDHEIAEWRRAMAAGGVGDPAVLDELESHLRDHVTQQVGHGQDVEQAFKSGVERVGQARVLKREFSRADRMPRLAGVAAVVDDRRKSFWAAVILSALVAGAYCCRHALATPLYEGAALFQIMRRPAQPDFPLNVAGNDIRSAEDLNLILRLLTSHRLRTSVAASLTPAEQKLVRWSATGRSISDDTPPVEEQLGALRVTSMRLSLAVRLSIVHEDAEAAALIANRYVEQCRMALRDMAESPPQVFFRVIDPATPSRYPISPNFLRIARTSIALGLATLIGLIAMAAALRKLMHMRVDTGPQVRTS